VIGRSGGRERTKAEAVVQPTIFDVFYPLLNSYQTWGKLLI
jgi:hypothetical protein